MKGACNFTQKYIMYIYAPYTIRSRRVNVLILDSAFSVTAWDGSARMHAISETLVINDFALTCPNLQAKHCLNSDNISCVESVCSSRKRTNIVARLLILQFCWCQTGMSLCKIMYTFLPPANIAHFYNFLQTIWRCQHQIGNVHFKEWFH
jgi:hypothetical protein